LREIIRKDGVEEGFFVEVYTPDSVPATDRWFMKIIDGSVIGTDPKKMKLKAGVFCSTNTLRLEPKSSIQSVEIKTILDAGPARYFEIPGSNGRVEPKAVVVPVVLSSQKLAPPRVWKKCTIGWLHSNGGLAPMSEKFCLEKKAKSVVFIGYQTLRQAMIDAKVPGTASSSNKDQLIKIMCMYNCEYTSLNTIGLAASEAPRSGGSGAAHAPDSTSSSDSDAPISRAAIALAKQAAADYAGNDYFTNKARESVLAVSISELRAAMKSVPGVGTCNTKEALIKLMIVQNFTYEIPTVISD
jgi:hypothetical protein